MTQGTTRRGRTSKKAAKRVAKTTKKVAKKKAPAKKATRRRNEPTRARASQGRRRTKFTPELGRRILKALEAGITSQTTAAAIAGVGKTAYFAWKGLATSGEPGTEDLQEFFQDVELALEQGEHAYFKRLSELALAGDVKSLTWILERRFPHKYAPPERLELTGKDGGPMKTESVNAASTELVEALTGLARSVRAKKETDPE